jgi:hypothetical protein
MVQDAKAPRNTETASELTLALADLLLWGSDCGCASGCSCAAASPSDLRGEEVEVAAGVGAAAPPAATGPLPGSGGRTGRRPRGTPLAAAIEEAANDEALATVAAWAQIYSSNGTPKVRVCLRERLSATFTTEQICLCFLATRPPTDGSWFAPPSTTGPAEHEDIQEEAGNVEEDDAPPEQQGGGTEEKLSDFLLVDRVAPLLLLLLLLLPSRLAVEEEEESFAEAEPEIDADLEADDAGEEGDKEDDDNDDSDDK